MDSYSEYPGEYDSTAAEPVAAGDDVAGAIGTDERRMHVRAYNYWVSLLDGRDYPSIEDLDPGSITDFAPQQRAARFHRRPATIPPRPMSARAIRAECGLPDDINQITEVPGRSLLSRLTDHYLQIIANRAPVGFEAEFVNQRGHDDLLSRDPDAVQPRRRHDRFHLWRDQLEGCRPRAGDRPSAPLRRAPCAPDRAGARTAEPNRPAARRRCARRPRPADLAWEDGPLADRRPRRGRCAPPEIDEETGLADHLSAARESAEVCKAADGRSRVALYRALGHGL